MTFDYALTRRTCSRPASRPARGGRGRRVAPAVTSLYGGVASTPLGANSCESVVNTFVLVHSPLVGPLTWSRVAEELRHRGIEALTPALPQDDDAAGPFWERHAGAIAQTLRALPADRSVILAGHSGAGPILPAIRREADRSVAAYLFVDAGLPENGQPRLGSGDFARQLRELYARGERFPNWGDELLRTVVPDPSVRRALLAELRPQPWAFWAEPIPVFAGWPDAPCAYLRFAPNPAYDAAAAEAGRRGWPCLELAGGHFHLLVDPAAVAEALLHLVRRMGNAQR